MITWIDVRDFLIVRHVEISFDGGLTVITGETGAGKSIIVDALTILLGDRTSGDIIRPGSEQCEVQAGFDLSNNPAAQLWLEGQEIDIDDSECTLRRIVSHKKSSRGFIQGRPVPISSLRELGQLLVDVHGQHEYHQLLKKTVQRKTLDAFAGTLDEVHALEICFDQLSTAITHLEELRAKADDSAQREDYLRHQVDELTALAPEPDELASLDSAHSRLSHTRELAEGTWQALHELEEGEDDTVLVLLGRVSDRLAELSKFDTRLANSASQLQDITTLLSDAVNDIRRCHVDYELDPEEFQRLDSRLTLLHDAARKYKVRPEQLRDLLERLSGELESITTEEQRILEVEQQISALITDYDALASRISQGRAESAAKLADAVTRQLADLGLEQAKFSVDLNPIETTSRTRYGAENVNFAVRTIPEMPFAPLDQVASGGELSRISLAIQVVTAQIDSVPSCIYDEVDIGIGGRIAEIVGSKLRLLGSQRQILCITHLPQVAVQGHGHLHVTKTDDAEVEICPLDPALRTDEIARMLGGIEITQQTLAHAEEMLQRVTESSLH